MYASLTSTLGQLKDLRVISKTSAKLYSNSEKNIQQIATELDVDAVVETSLLTLGDSIKLQMNIINAFPEELPLWSRTYSVVKSDILNLYSTITANIADEINYRLSPGQAEDLKRSKYVDPQVYESYLKGILRMGDLTKQGQEDAIGYFLQAINMDEEFAPAHAGIGGVWAFMKQMDYATPEEADPNIEKYLNVALSLDSTIAEVYYFKGIKSVWTDYEWEKGGWEFEKALDLNPSMSDAHALYSHYLMCMGKWQEARSEMDKALQIDPLSPFVKALHGMVLLNEEKYEKCIEVLEPLSRFIPDNPLVNIGLMISYFRLDNPLKSFDQTKRYVGAVGNPRALDSLILTFNTKDLKSAMHSAAVVLEEDIEAYPCPTQTLYTLYVLSEDFDKTLYWLERNFIRKDPTMPYIAAVSFLKDVRDEPRYLSLVKRMKLEHTLQPSSN